MREPPSTMRPPQVQFLYCSGPTLRHRPNTLCGDSSSEQPHAHRITSRFAHRRKRVSNLHREPCQASTRTFARVFPASLTFDMSGGTRWAKPAVARPLDGWVRPACKHTPQQWRPCATLLTRRSFLLLDE